MLLPIKLLLMVARLQASNGVQDAEGEGICEPRSSPVALESSRCERPSCVNFSVPAAVGRALRTALHTVLHRILHGAACRMPDCIQVAVRKEAEWWCGASALHVRRVAPSAGSARGCLARPLNGTHRAKALSQPPVALLRRFARGKKLRRASNAL